MKQKDISQITKTSILNAARKIILVNGASALTLEAVAHEAGISKGGLLYHFPSKKSLVEGMINHMITAMDASIEEYLAAGEEDYLSAFTRAAFKDLPELVNLSIALVAAISNDPKLLNPVQARYMEWQRRITKSTTSPEKATIVRLALDGLWVSDLFELAPPPPETRQKLMEELLSMAKKNS